MFHSGLFSSSMFTCYCDKIARNTREAREKHASRLSDWLRDRKRKKGRALVFSRVSGRFARRSVRPIAARPDQVDSPEVYLSFFKPEKKEKNMERQ